MQAILGSIVSALQFPLMFFVCSINLNQFCDSRSDVWCIIDVQLVRDLLTYSSHKWKPLCTQWDCLYGWRGLIAVRYDFKICGWPGWWRRFCDRSLRPWGRHNADEEQANLILFFVFWCLLLLSLIILLTADTARSTTLLVSSSTMGIKSWCLSVEWERRNIEEAGDAERDLMRMYGCGCVCVCMCRGCLRVQPSHKHSHSPLVSPFSHFLNILFLPYCYFKESFGT